MAPSDPFGLAGQVLDGQFRVDRFVGDGGFSSVYRGTHLGLSEPIAIKCLKLPAALGSALVESFVQRFRDESRLHYRLSQGHLHIARSIASGTTISPATGALVPYTVLEWLDGHSLDKELGDRRAAGQRGRPLPDVVKLLDSAVDAIAYAHAQGVVHRDLNPGNFFLARTPLGTKLKVLDFGVAKIMADSAIAIGPTARTVGNIRIFAPAYGAPEQFDERVGAVGPWTDVYTLALVALEALVDRSVMEGEHLGQYAARALDPNRPSPRTLGARVGPEVDRVFVRALALRPTERPRDAGEWWGSLKHSMQRDASESSGPPATERVGPKPYAATLRMSEPAPIPAPAIEVAAQPRSSAPAGGSTLRIEPRPRRSATEAPVAAPIPAPARPSTPEAPRASAPDVARASAAHAAPIALPRSPTATALLLALGVVVTVGTLSVVGVRAWRAHQADRASSAGAPPSR